MPPKKDPGNIHFIGICGRAMGPLAAALIAEGYHVTGSDQKKASGPAAEFLLKSGIPFSRGYAAEHVPSNIDLAVIGIETRGNPEIEAVLEKGIECCTYPELIQRLYLRDSRNYVVAGTNGKTTTTSILTFIMETAGLEPNYLIGGEALNFPRMTRLKKGRPITVLEGDEYRAGGWNRNPKFYYYLPKVAVITNIRNDHPELYRDLAEVKEVFSQLIDGIPADGCLILNAEDPGTPWMQSHCHSQSFTVGFSGKADFRITRPRSTRQGGSFTLLGHRFNLPLWGRMNMSNAAMAILAAQQESIPLEICQKALSSFAGIRHRQEIIYQGEHFLHIADEAYLPQAVESLLQSVRKRFRERRLIVLLRPRSTGPEDWMYRKEMPESLRPADVVLITDAFNIARIHDEPFDSALLCEDLQRQGQEANYLPVRETTRRFLEVDVPDFLRVTLKRGDVLVTCISNQFSDSLGPINRLMASLEAEAGRKS